MQNIEDLYAQLKTNLEKQGNYHDAGEFHMGEQETRLMRAKKFSWFYLTGTAYKWMAGYGERPLWAIRSLVLLLFAFSFLLGLAAAEEGFLGAVIKNVSFIDDNVRSFQDFWYVCSIFPDTNFANRWGEEFLRLVTPFSWRYELKEGSGLTQSFLYYLLLIFFQIIVYIQIPLLIMSVRRRFKR